MIAALVARVYRQVLDELEPEAREAVRAVRVVVKAHPDAQDLQRGCVPHQMAAFYGCPRELGVQGARELPDPAPASGEIILFAANLAPITEERVRIALLHELGHAVGLEEDEIRAAGLFLAGSEDRCST